MLTAGRWLNIDSAHRLWNPGADCLLGSCLSATHISRCDFFVALLTFFVLNLVLLLQVVKRITCVPPICHRFLPITVVVLLIFL